MPSGSLELAKGSPEDDTYKAEVRERAAADEKRRVLVMKGSRMDALDWATDSLLKAATELEGEIRKETKYWDEILSISEKSWSLQRTRKGARNAQFAVRYGPPEGMNHYHPALLQLMTRSEPCLQVAGCCATPYGQGR